MRRFFFLSYWNEFILLLFFFSVVSVNRFFSFRGKKLLFTRQSHHCRSENATATLQSSATECFATPNATASAKCEFFFFHFYNYTNIPHVGFIEHALLLFKCTCLGSASVYSVLILDAIGDDFMPQICAYCSIAICNNCYANEGTSARCKLFCSKLRVA